MTQMSNAKQYRAIRFRVLVENPACPGDYNRLDYFAAPAYDLSVEDDTVTVVHVESGRAIDVPWSAVMYATRDVLQKAQTIEPIAEGTAVPQGQPHHRRGRK